MSDNYTSQVVIGDNFYENVTESWEPYLDNLGSTLTLVLPSLYVLLASVLLFLLGRHRFGFKHVIKMYRDRRNVIYFTDYFGDELYALITQPVDLQIKLKINKYRHDCKMREQQLKSNSLQSNKPASLGTVFRPAFAQPPFRPMQATSRPFAAGQVSTMQFQRPRFVNQGLVGMTNQAFRNPAINIAAPRAPIFPTIQVPQLPSPLGTMNLPPEVYELFDKPNQLKYHIFWRNDGIYLSMPGLINPVRFSDKLDGVVHKPKRLLSVRVSGKDLIEAQKCRPFCCDSPKVIRLSWNMMKLIVLPLGKVLVDIADVIVDMYYFVRLDRGVLVHRSIMRNVHVNYGILAFGITGALKSTIFAYLILEVVNYNDGPVSNVRTNFLEIIAACLKIVAEDGPELVLEYFYVDKYITTNEPWWIICKDAVSALLYLVPIVGLLKSGWGKFKLLRTSSSLYLDIFGTHVNMFKWSTVFVCCTFVHLFFTLAMMVRVWGMIYQYQSGNVEQGCLEVTEAGELIQTPFHRACLNGFDYVILSLVSTVGFLCLIIVIYVILVKVGDVFRGFQSRYKNMVNYSVDGERCSVRADLGCSTTEPEIVTLTFNCEKRLFSKESKRKDDDFGARWKVKNHFTEK